MIAEIREELGRLADPERAAINQRFFKTAPGEYGDGDRFLGIPVPAIRRVARRHRSISLTAIDRLLRSPWHEMRLLALIILVQRYARADASEQSKIYRLYLDRTRYINNWDLVDCSAEHIVGAHLWQRDRSNLQRLAVSDSLWERRIAVLATFHFIKRGEFEPTFDLAERLLADREDLIHKAVGWMLREIGKRDRKAEEQFIQAHYRRMPRTMLRYAIEHFAPDRRRAYLKGRI